MLSPQLRNKVHSLWTMFWTAGMTNPLVAVEQITTCSSSATRIASSPANVRAAPGRLRWC